MNPFKNISIAFVLTVLAFAIPGGVAHAQIGGSTACNASVAISQNVPIFDQNTQIKKDVDCTWNGLAWQMAHVALQQLTGSVVNWINSGFKGSPSFVSNPEAFFLNLNDQVVGSFIGNSGILAKALCSPFNNAIRLSLALGQQDSYNNQYACTLSKIIDTQKGNIQNIQNGPNVTVTQSSGGATLGDYISGSALRNSDQISVNGHSISSAEAAATKGGVSGMVLLFTEPGNSWSSASLAARSDLSQQLAARNAAVNNDLNRGGGFLSWQSCKNVPTSDPEKDKRQVCTTQTPGSFVNASLVKATGASADELNLTNEINQVVSALFSQLLTHTLNNGLLSSSHKNGSSKSYADMLSDDPDLQRNFKSLQKQAANQYKNYLAAAQKAYMYENQAAGIMTAELGQFQNVQACVAATATSTTSFNAVAAQQALPAINSTITNTLIPLTASYTTAAYSASSSIQIISNMIDQLSTATSAQAISDLANQFSNQLSSGAFGSTPDPQTAKTDLNDANAKVADLKKDLKSYQNLCGA